MQEKDMLFQEAFQFASKRRPVIFPNMGFQRQLCEFEKLLHLKKSYSSPNRVDKLTAKIVNGPPAATVAASGAITGLNTNYGTNRS